MSEEIGRNDPCHCGSGKKYKKCHLEKDELKNQKLRQEAALNAAKVANEKEEEQDKNKSSENRPPEPKKGWFHKVAGKVGFMKNVSLRRNNPQNKGG